MLTAQEKAFLREYLCDPNRGVGISLSPTVLADFAERSDEEIRIVLSEYKLEKISGLSLRVDIHQSELDRLNAIQIGEEE